MRCFWCYEVNEIIFGNKMCYNCWATRCIWLKTWLNRLLRTTEFTRRKAISIQSQSWNMLLTNYLLTVSHLGSAVHITVILLLYYYSIEITWNHVWLLFAHALLSLLLLLCLQPFLANKRCIGYISIGPNLCVICRVAQKSKPLPNNKKNCVKSY